MNVSLLVYVCRSKVLKECQIGKSIFFCSPSIFFFYSDWNWVRFMVVLQTTWRTHESSTKLRGTHGFSARHVIFSPSSSMEGTRARLLRVTFSTSSVVSSLGPTKSPSAYTQYKKEIQKVKPVVHVRDEKIHIPIWKYTLQTANIYSESR